MKPFKKVTLLLVVAPLLIPTTRTAIAEELESNTLKIDPLLIAQAREVWKQTATNNNRIWPHWNSATTPILFYLPSQQDILINHPSPPDGFVKYNGPLNSPDFTIHVKNGDTLIAHDGQNTSIEVNGIQTLVVADTLSNRKNQVAGYLFDPRSAQEKLNDLEYRNLSADPYHSMGMIVHEAFHAYQMQHAADKGANELALETYPLLSVHNNLGFGLEGISLFKALTSGNVDEVRAYTIQFLAARLQRREELSKPSIDYENAIEFMEGLAKYTEYKLSQSIEGQKPAPAMNYLQGFKGFGDLSFFRDELANTTLRHMKGEINVNNAPYGAAPLRMRLYYSGMALGVLLDHFSPLWKEVALTSDKSLTQFLLEAVKPTEPELERSRTQLMEMPEYAQLKLSKEELFDKGQQQARSKLDALLTSPNTTVVLDYSAVEDAHIAMGFSPFGITQIEKGRTLYEQVPIGVRVREGSGFQLTFVTPVLKDELKHQFVFNLNESLEKNAIMNLLGDDIATNTETSIKSLALPGVQLSLGKVSVTVSDNKIQFNLLP